MAPFERFNSNSKNNWDLAIFGPPVGAQVMAFRKSLQQGEKIDFLRATRRIFLIFL
jgi:hypothetical protein